MTHIGTNKPLTAKKLHFAKLCYEGKLTYQEISAEVGISDRTAYRWIKREEILMEVVRLGKADKERAARILERGSVKAAEALLELLEKEGWGKLFNQETCRKAACDILAAVGLKVERVEAEGFGNSSIVIVQSGDGDRSAEGHPLKAVPDRFRFQQN